MSIVTYVKRNVEQDVTVMSNVMYDLYDRLRLLLNHECDGYDEQQSPAAAMVPWPPPGHLPQPSQCQT